MAPTTLTQCPIDDIFGDKLMFNKIVIISITLIIIHTNIFSLNRIDKYKDKVLSIWPNLEILQLEPGMPTVFYNKDLSNIQKGKKNKSFIKCGTIKLSNSSKKFEIKCSAGPSHDPTTVLTSIVKGKQKDYVFGAYCIIFPGNGHIYTIDSGRGFINEHRKFQIIDDKIIEVKQPLQYVGFETEALTDITLFYEKKQKNIVGYIPKGNKTFIIGGIIEKSDVYYLLQTKFGLVGWHKLEIYSVHETSLKNIYGNPD